MRSHLSALSLAAGLAALPAADLFAADHLDAPAVRGNGSIDINDLYAFQSPANPDNTVFILTVNPGAGAISGTEFSAGTFYNINIDTDGDATVDLAFSTFFDESADGRQGFNTVVSGDVPGSITDRTAGSIAFGSTGETTVLEGGGAITAGVFDDPFFFDLEGFNDGFNFTGDDFFAGLDVSAIVLELPSSDLGAQNIGVWATTVSDDLPMDQIGRPAINTVLTPEGRKNEFNTTAPIDQPDAFGDAFEAKIAELNGGDLEAAASITSVLLPDILTFDTSDASGFLNGRRLQDDVIDAELSLLTGGALTSDGVDGNDAAFLDVFPYLAERNIPEPTSLVLLGLGGAALLSRRRA